MCWGKLTVAQGMLVANETKGSAPTVQLKLNNPGLASPLTGNGYTLKEHEGFVGIGTGVYATDGNCQAFCTTVVHRLIDIELPALVQAIADLPPIALDEADAKEQRETLLKDMIHQHLGDNAFTPPEWAVV